MRSFSNIMPNFAGYLHLLVDSIFSLQNKPQPEKVTEIFCATPVFVYLCTRI